MTTGAPVASSIGEISYQLDLPAGYRLVRDSSRKQEWEPGSGDGLAFRVKVSERVRLVREDEPGELAEPAPCPPAERPLSVGEAYSEKDGEECY